MTDMVNNKPMVVLFRKANLLLAICMLCTSFSLASEIEVAERKKIYIPGDRLALLIGNSNYEDGIFSHLKNGPIHDVKLISDTLSKQGFKIFGGIHTDLSSKEFERLLDSFQSYLINQPQDIVFFYYAGHGVQATIKSAKGLEVNEYLIPVGSSQGSSISELVLASVTVNGIATKISEVSDALSVIVVDACRDNAEISGPLISKLNNTTRKIDVDVRYEPETRGLSSFKSAKLSSSIIAFASAANHVAGNNPYGPSKYAHALANALGREGETITDIFSRARSEVIFDSGGTQTPEFVNRLLPRHKNTVLFLEENRVLKRKSEGQSDSEYLTRVLYDTDWYDMRVREKFEIIVVNLLAEGVVPVKYKGVMPQCDHTLASLPKKYLREAGLKCVFDR